MEKWETVVWCHDHQQREDSEGHWMVWRAVITIALVAVLYLAFVAA